MYQEIGNEKIVIEFKNLINNADEYVETLDVEFIKFKMLSASNNN